MKRDLQVKKKQRKVNNFEYMKIIKVELIYN